MRLLCDYKIIETQRGDCYGIQRQRKRIQSPADHSGAAGRNSGVSGHIKTAGPFVRPGSSEGRQVVF